MNDDQLSDSYNKEINFVSGKVLELQDGIENKPFVFLLRLRIAKMLIERFEKEIIECHKEHYDSKMEYAINKLVDIINRNSDVGVLTINKNEKQ